MKALLVNASAPGYTLGLEKAANWWRAQGAAVEFAREVPTLFLESYDAVWISAIFSWHVPGLKSMAQRALDAGKPVEVGGPGPFGAREQIRQKTGLSAQAHPDPRFEQQPGSYRMVFWSRGCPATHCSLGFPRNGGIPVCSVPQMEGRHFTLYEDVTPAPVILDNNLSGLPQRHQELIVERTLSAGFPRVDCNSGFEPRSIHQLSGRRGTGLVVQTTRHTLFDSKKGESATGSFPLRSTVQQHMIGSRREGVYDIADR